MLCRFRIGVQQVLHRTAFYHVLFNNLNRIVRGNLNIERIVRQHLNNRALFAKAKTTGRYHLNFILKLKVFENPVEFFFYFIAF